MPRKSKSKAQPESPAGQAAVDAQHERLEKQIAPVVEALKEQAQEYTQPGEIPLQHPDYKLAREE